MSEQTRISPDHIEQLFMFVVNDLLFQMTNHLGKGWQKWVKEEPFHKFKPKEVAEVDEVGKCMLLAVRIGLLLAKRQPELVDAQLKNLESRGASLDEFMQGMMDVYQAFLEWSGCTYEKSDRINPALFVQFLDYYATGLLREMSKHMDKEWHKRWQKEVKGEPRHRFKSEERLKVDTVSNFMGLAITTGLMTAKAQPQIASVDWSKGDSLDTIWELVLTTYRRLLYYKYFVERKI